MPRPGTQPVPCRPSASHPYAAYAPTTTTLDSSGASAGATNRRCACRTPARTMPTPYSTTCGANTTSIRVAEATWPAQSSGTNHPAMGPASTASRTASGSSASTAQVSSADAVRLASARSPHTSGAASRGMTVAASAPPATTSNSTLGTRLAEE